MERINLQEGDSRDHLALALKAIRDGYVICAPGDGGYLLLSDAFSEFAVRSMHVLRGNDLGVAAQVLIHSAATLPGIAREISDEVLALAEKFWPGPLSLNLRPQRGLNWDLGDNNELDRLSVRVPISPFISTLLKESGPLASISAAPVGAPALVRLEDLSHYAESLTHAFDGGELVATAPSTVVEADLQAMTIIREGAISQTLLAEVAPALSQK